jgi:hypothetical protein
MEPKGWDIFMQYASLVGTVSTIVLGLVAIFLSLYLYRLSNELSLSTRTTLSRIETSSRVSEVTSRDMLHPIVTAVVDTISGGTRQRFTEWNKDLMRVIGVAFDRISSATTEDDKRQAREQLIKQIDALVRNMPDDMAQAASELAKHALHLIELSPQTAVWAVPQVKTEKDLREAVLRVQELDQASVGLSPGTSDFSWVPFLRRIRDLEKNHPFLSVKWLDQKRFAERPEDQPTLQIAIKKGILITYSLPNPTNPGFPTLACRLNREHPLVTRVLTAVGDNDSSVSSS